MKSITDSVSEKISKLDGVFIFIIFFGFCFIFFSFKARNSKHISGISQLDPSIFFS